MSADLAVLVTDPGAIERASDPAIFVIEACERAKAWLREVLDHGDIDMIVEVKSQAEAVRVYTMQKQLGKDAELSAAEIVRRAERGIGVAIRRGQEDGTIRRQGQSRITHQPGNTELVASPTDYATGDELGGNDAGIYHLTDDVSDEVFEDAVEEARAEQNLSRANVVRKVRGGQDCARTPLERRLKIAELAGEAHTSRQIAGRLGITEQHVRQLARDHGIEIPADKIVGRSRHIDANRIVRETVHALEGAAMGVDLIDPNDLDPAETGEWAASLTNSIRVLNRLVKTMRETTQ